MSYVHRLDAPPGADRCLDTLGTFCPVPVIRTARAVGEMQCGEILELRSDDRGVLGDIPDWCLAHGHEFLGWLTAADHYRLYVRKI